MMDRREALHHLGILCLGTTVTPFISTNQLLPIVNEDHPQPYQHPIFNWVNQINGPRPEIGWFSGEEYIYHELRLKPEWQSAPEFTAFLERPYVLNRYFFWQRIDDFIFVYAKGGELPLSGEKAAGNWYSDNQNQIYHQGAYTIFEARSTHRIRDAVILPAFQCHLSQHPEWYIEVEESSAHWQIVLSIKGRSGKPLWHSTWQQGKARIRLPVKTLLSDKGYDNNYCELHLAIAIWKEAPANAATIRFKAYAPTQQAIILPLPPIRPSKKALKIPFLWLNNYGEPTTAIQAQISPSVGDTILPSFVQGIFFWVQMPPMPAGNHVLNVALQTENFHKLTGKQIVRFTTEEQRLKATQPSTRLAKGKDVISPITGTYAGIVHVKDPGTPNEKLIHKQEEYNELPDLERHYHFWESLTPTEMDQRMAYLASQGVDMLHLCQGWGIWKKLDGGGCINPHGAEQVALYYRTAAQHHMYVIQALSHYPYAEKVSVDGWYGTRPDEKYFQAGFQDSDWQNPSDSAFDKLFSQYLHDFGCLFRYETALAMLSSSGEGDPKAGIKRCQWIRQKMATFCPDTLFYAEPIHLYEQLPAQHTKDWNFERLGSRTYTLGTHVKSDIDLAIYFRLNQMDHRLFMAEGAFPAPHLYSRFHIHPDEPQHNTWLGTEYYRRHVRDSLYIGFLKGQHILMTWEEQFTEGERLVLNQLRKWMSRPYSALKPSVAVCIDAKVYQNRVHSLAVLEQIVNDGAHADYRLVAQPAKDALINVDLRGDWEKTHPYLAVKQLPENWQKLSPFKIAGTYRIHWNYSADKKYILLYALNVSRYIEHEVFYSKIHRHPIPDDLYLAWPKLNPSEVLLWPLDGTNQKPTLIHKKEIALTQTVLDYFIAFKLK